MIEAKKIAEALEVEPIIREKRIIRRKKHFDENIDEEQLAQSTLESFKVNYFLYVVDQALSSLNSRFE